MNKEKMAIFIMGAVVGGVIGWVSPFFMRLSENWLGGIVIVIIVGCLIGVIGGLITKLILKKK